jgi:predicted secreted protein
MDIFTGFIVFFLIWWTALFVVLPWGLKRDERGLPNDPRLKKKVIATTVLSVLIWIAIYFMIQIEVIDFYAIAENMMKQDYGR